MNKKLQKQLLDMECLSYLDIHFARYMTSFMDHDDEALFLAAALVSAFREQGHVCLDLRRVGGRPLFFDVHGKPLVTCPDPEVWKQALEKSPMVGKPGEYRPLILDDRFRLYLYRYFEYQERLAVNLLKRAQGHGPDIDQDLLKKGMNRLFPKTGDTDRQKAAAITALNKRFCVISGGPGTGKTTTVAKIIALILEQADENLVRIALAAPTGKAASRLQEALKATKENLTCADRIKEKIPMAASTIHRLLGALPDSPYFRYHAENLLPVDVVMVDEASMVDLALMSKLVQAIPFDARLILLGDRDQLASVEAGAALGDICDAGGNRELQQPVQQETMPDAGQKNGAVLANCIIQLQKSYRFGSDSGIQMLSRAVKAGNGILALELLKNKHDTDIHWKTLPQLKNLPILLKDKIIREFNDYSTAKNPKQALDCFDRFQMICALRQGPYGVTAINQLTEEILKQAGLIHPRTPWYPGRPILITRNDHTLNLFNGDVGVVFPDPDADHDLRVFFPDADGSLKKLHPLRLPEHETVYAMTIHRSQGSEFDEVVMILPDRDSPVLTRELMYTGITRAGKCVEVWGTEDVFCEGVLRETARVSGLRDALWAS